MPATLLDIVDKTYSKKKEKKNTHFYILFTYKMYRFEENFFFPSKNCKNTQKREENVD